MCRGRKAEWIMLAVLLCCVWFAGCGKKNTAADPVTGQENVQNGTAQAQGASVANPWKEMTEEEIKKVTGKVFQLPEDAKNVHYRYLEAERMTEADFEWKSHVFVVRRKPENEMEDISGMYYDWVIQNDIMVDRFTGQIKTAYPEQEVVNVCLWYQDEEQMAYSLSASGADLSDEIRTLAEKICAPDQKGTEAE